MSTPAVKIKGLSVNVKVSHGDSKSDHQMAVSRALNELKKEIKKDGLMDDIKRREFYRTPSAAKKHKTNEAIKQRKRDERKNFRQNTTKSV